MSDMAIHYTRRPISVEDYHRMGDAGIFGEDERVELLDGELILMPPMGNPHAGGVVAITELLVLRFSSRATIRPQVPLLLDLRSEPEPDLAIVAFDARGYRDRSATPKDVFWLIEVSDTSRWVDFHKKAPIYARAGIPEYWIVDVVERRLIVHREPGPHGFASTTILQPNDSIASLAFPNDVFTVRDFTG